MEKRTTEKEIPVPIRLFKLVFAIPLTLLELAILLHCQKKAIEFYNESIDFVNQIKQSQPNIE